MDTPLISIGVPIYNDAVFLRRALDRLVQQDYANLEIILADDGSTDSSREICREYAEQRDTRIRFIENYQNLGALSNHRLVLELSKGEYFAWASGHDYLNPSFVSQTLKILQTHPTVLLCCPRSVFEDENGRSVRTPIGGLDTRGFPPVERFNKVLAHLTGGGTANIFYGLYRRSALAQVNPFRKVIGHDGIALGELSILGDIVQIDDILYHRLDHRNMYGNNRVERHQQYLLINKRKIEALTPSFSMLCEYLNMLESSNLTDPEKQALFESISGEANRIKVTISREIEAVIQTVDQTLNKLVLYPALQQYWASRYLDTMNKARIFGYDDPGLFRTQKICLSILGINISDQLVPHKRNGWSEKLVSTWLNIQSTVKKSIYR